MALASGELLEGGSVTFQRHRVQGHRNGLDRPWLDFGSARPGDEQFHAAHRLNSPPQLAHGRDPIDARLGCQTFHQRARDPLGLTQQEASGALPVMRDRSEELFLELGAHPRQVT